MDPHLLLQMLMTVSNMTLQRQESHNMVASRNNWESSYDYIVVGAGAAGAVVASRLSENPKVKVLLIEAGGPENIVHDISIMAELDQNNEIWTYYTPPQTRICNSYKDKQCQINMAKMLGGSSSHNGMQYVRGIPNDFDIWESEYGAKNWSYANVLKYFIRSENQSDMEILSKRSQYHGRDGPLELTSTLYKNESFNLDFIKAVQTLGYDYQIELNSPPYSNKRIAYLQITLTNGHRDSTSFAFLESKKQYLRPNLHVLANSVASKVLFDNNKRAIGVRFYRNGKFYQVNATKEIILSCGAIESPKLLMLSGIGPMIHLQSKKIQVIADLPVGENFMTHVIMGIISLADSPQYVWSLQNLYLYYLNGTGPLTKFGGFYPYSQFTTKYGNKPDIATYTYGHQLINLLLHPLSKGTVRLNSTDPFDAPIVDPNYLSNETDREIWFEGLRESFRIAKKMNQYGQKLTIKDNFCEPCNKTVDVFDDPCDKYLECLTRMYAFDGHHFGGSCRIGSKYDDKAVVDERLKVRNLNGLRVVDASIIPRLISGGTYATSIMIGEYGAQLIKDDAT